MPKKKQDLLTMKKTSFKDLEKILSVNTLLVIVVLLELLLAMYLILSQNAKISKIIQPAIVPPGETADADVGPSATLSLASDSGSFLVGEGAEIAVLLGVDSLETISTVECRIKYDPNYIKINNIITRGPFKLAGEMDDPITGVYSFVLYSMEGEQIADSEVLAGLTITPQRSGKTSLDFVVTGSTINTSLVMRHDEPVDLLQKVEELSIVIE